MLYISGRKDTNILQTYKLLQRIVLIKTQYISGKKKCFLKVAYNISALRYQIAKDYILSYYYNRH